MKHGNNTHSNNSHGASAHGYFPLTQRKFSFRGTLKHTALTDTITIYASSEAEAAHKASTFADNLVLERIENV